MDAETCLKKLSYVGVLSFATVDEMGAPQIRCVSAIHYEPDAMYFFTARGKDFRRELQRDGRVQVLGYTKYKEMTRLSGVARAVSQQEHWRSVILQSSPISPMSIPGIPKASGSSFPSVQCPSNISIWASTSSSAKATPSAAGLSAPKATSSRTAVSAAGNVKASVPSALLTPGIPIGSGRSTVSTVGTVLSTVPQKPSDACEEAFI